MDGQTDDFIDGIWSAINAENMAAKAWADCFSRYADLRSDEYRQIVFVVVLLFARRPNECTPSTIQRIISNRDMLDQKTVAARVQRLVDCKLFEITPHPADKRKKLIRPTTRLLEPLKRYSTLTLSIAHELLKQASAAGITPENIDPYFKFNLLEYLSALNTDEIALPERK